MKTGRVFRFRLYVADESQNSSEAVANLTALCETYFPGKHQIEIVDVLREPQRALADGIFMTPTLIKLQPAPVRKVVGTLSHTATVLTAFGLPVPAR